MKNIKTKDHNETTKLNFYIFLALAVFIVPNLLFAQFIQQGQKLVGTGAVGTSTQGTSVSISSDGNTAIVGGPSDNSNKGAAWVFTRSSGVWTQQGLKLVGTGSVGNSKQGNSVAISSDGNTAIIGGYGDNANTGAVWVFTRSGGVWTQQGTKLVGSGSVGGSYQGYSVAISSDGNTAVIGGPYDNVSAGAIWVFTRSGGVWTQQGAKLIGTGAVGGAYQGISVAISSDGNTAIVGGFGDNSFAGAVWVFTRSGGVWTQQGSKLVGTGAIGNAYLGCSVAVSSVGNTAIAGGYGDNANAGAVWVFTRSGSVWAQQGPKLVGTGLIGVANQGFSVSISSDGNTAVEGGPYDNGSKGAAWVFTRNGSVWTQQGTKFIGTGTVGNSQQGYSVAISSNSGTFIEGGQADNGSVGAAWVFVNPSIGVTTISTEIPGNFSLSQNYPNPFNPSTNIRYDLPKNGFVKLVVFDMLSREVEILVNENQTAGTYEATFNSSKHSSGVYFYKLTTDNFTETKKMLMIK